MADKVIRFKGDFDASQILASLKSIRSEMEKGGAAPSLFKGVDKDINKAESLVKELLAQINTGFKTTKEVDNFKKKFDTLTQVFAKARIGLNDINKIENFNKPSKALQDLNAKLEKIATAEAEVSSNAAEAAKSLKSISTKEARAEIQKAIDAGEDLEAVMKRVATAQFSKGQSSLNKILSKGDEKGIEKSFMDFDTSKLSIGSNLGQRIGSVEAYKKALLELATSTKPVEEVFKKLKENLDEQGQEFLETGEFAKSYMEDLRNLSLEAAKANGLGTSAGSIGKAISTMGGAGAVDASGNLYITEKETEAIQKYIDLLKEKGIITEQIAQEEIVALAEATNKQQNFNNVLKGTEQEQEKLADTTDDSIKLTQNQIQAQDELNTAFERLSGTAKRIFSITTAWQVLRRTVKQTFTDIKELDKAFGSIAMVTNYSVSQLWQQYGTYADLANKLGQTTKGVVEASSLYYQQGLETAEVMSLTEETMKLATLAGLDFKEATSQMTAAIRAFKLEMTDGAHVTDVYAELAAHAAASVNDISQAMSATAAIAHSAGMEFETTAAMLTTMIEATQEAPKNLGTALKAVIARFTELKENVSKVDSEFDDLDYNKVDKALKSVGISLKDSVGQFRDLDDVFRELSGKWDALDRNTQRYVATIAAGSRQQSRFIALMENHARTEELIETAYNSAGKSAKQFAKFQDTVEFKVNQLKNTWEQVRTSFLDSSFYSGIIQGLTTVAEKFKNFDWKKLLISGPIFLITGRLLAKQLITGFTQGTKNLKSIIQERISSITKGRLKTVVSIEADISRFQRQISILKQTLDSIDNGTFSQGELQSHITELSNKGQELNAIEKERLELLIKINKAYNESTTNGIVSTEDFKNRISSELNNLEELAQNKTSKLKFAQFGKGLTSAIGYSVSTGIMMGLNGNFSVSEIMKTNIATSLASTVSSVASGQWQVALGQATVAGISFILKQVADKWAESAEKIKLANDQVYAHQKAIERLEEEQEKLNELRDKANSEYDEQNEQYTSFTDAKETYEELSQKILLTEEEQEKLNEATQKLAELHPELVASYDDQKNAILKVGSAWDDVIEKEERAYKLARKQQVQAELDAVQQEYETAKEYSKLDTATRIEREELYSGRTIAMPTVVKGTGLDIQYKNINDILNMDTWDARALINNAYNDDAERYVEWLIDYNSEFAKGFLDAVNKAYNGAKIFATAEDAYDDIFNGSPSEENEKWEKIVKNLKEKFKEWEELAGTDLNTGDLKQIEALKNGFDTILNQLDYLLYDMKIEDKAKKQLLNMLQKRNITDDKLKEALDNGSTLETYGQFIYDNEQELIKAYQNLDEFQSSLLSDFYTNYQDRNEKENLAALQELKNNGIADVIIQSMQDYDMAGFNKAVSEYIDKLRQVYGDSFNNSELYQIFTDLGLKAQDALIKSLGNISKEQKQYAVHNINTFLSELRDGIDKSKVLSNLASQDWKGMGIFDLETNKEQFVEFAKTVDIGTEEAIDIWNNYKHYMETSGVLDLSKSINSETLATTIEEKLKANIEGTNKITNVISNFLEKGFLNFSESTELKEACEKIGLNAEKYLVASKEGYVLDIGQLQNDIIEQSSEEKLQEQVEKIIEERKEELETQIDGLQALKDEIEGENTRTQVLKNNTKEMEKQAALAYLIAHNDTVQNIDQAKNILGISDSDITGNVSTADINARIGELQSKLKDLNDKTGEEWAKAWKQIKDDTRIGTNEIQALFDKIYEDYNDKLEEATKNYQKAIDDVIQKEQEYYKTINGDPNHKNKLDPLNNYTELLDSITYKANKAKNALDDLRSGDNVADLLNTYTGEVHNEVVARAAEDKVIKQAMANAEANLAKYSDYWHKVGDQYYIDYDKLNAASMPDDRSDEIENQIDQLRKWRDELRKNSDTIDDLRKDFEESQKKYLEAYINLENEVIDKLKEHYQEEIDNLKDKYDAMKEADDDYLDALESAIEKERKLRDRANEWDDLAKKEKKLSLMSRDTSGANQVEKLKLQKEVEKDRTKLLDNAVDDVIDSLKEMYKLQQEEREVELEYLNAMLDNAELIKQANEVIAGFNNEEDVVNWFTAMTDTTQISQAQLELEKKNWKDLYNAKVLYQEASQLDFEKFLKASEAEIEATLKSITETATTESTRSWNEVEQKIKDTQQAALDAWNEAKKVAQEAEEAIASTVAGLVSIPAGMAAMLGAFSQSLETTMASVGESAKINSIANSIMPTIDVGSALTSVLNSKNIGSEAARYYQEQGQSKNTNGETYLTNLNQNVIPTPRWKSQKEMDTWISSWNNPMNTRLFLPEVLEQYKAENGEETLLKWLSMMGVHGVYRNNAIYKSAYEIGKKFETGGLVNYTGPAWVDGSPSAPEAFLNPEDTRRIGEAAKLLADLPILNGNISQNISTSTVGDTTIALTVNFDSISEEYDAQRVIELMKEKIVEAARYTGSNVILQQ